MQFKHPYTCCKYPMRKILDRDQNNCRLKCSAVNDQKCCLLNCKYRETGVYVNGEFNDQALLRLYENFMNVNGAGKYDRWMAVIEKSIKKCERLRKNMSLLFVIETKEILFSSSQRQNHQLQHSRIRHRHYRLREPHELPRLSNARANRAMFSSTRLRQNTRSLWQKAKRNRLDNPRILGFSVDRSNGEINFISFYFKIAFLSQ